MLVDGLAPAEWPADPDLEWCPPGHGDLYTALQTSGHARPDARAGYRYAFVSNSDNLAAVLDPRILAWMAASRRRSSWRSPTARRPTARAATSPATATVAGCCCARSRRCPDEDLDAFQDVSRHRYFNTNTMWLDLRAVAAELERRDGVLGLPLIRNRKTVDPSDKGSPRSSRSRPRWGRPWACSRGRGPCACRARASRRSRRRRTC